jgi:chaperone protein EcpD
VDVGGKSFNADSGMVDPFGSLRLKVKDLASAPATGTPVAFEIVNDYGATASFKGSVSP